MAKQKKQVKSRLIQALEFLQLCGRGSDERAEYCMMDSQNVVSFNSVIAVGTTIEEGMSACPHMAMLLAGLDRSGDSYVITQLSPYKLLLRAGTFQAFIPCLDPSALSWPVPDPPIVDLDNRLLDALLKIVPLVDAKGETVLEQSIQLNAGSVFATNRSVLAEAWHGIDLPCGLLIPKAIVTALKKAKKHLKQFGCSKVTATFYFEDDTWMRTQLFQDRWPSNVTAYLNCPINAHKVPPYLFEAAEKVSPFSTGNVYVKGNMISSHPFDAKEIGSSLQLPIGGELKERIYKVNDLDYASKFAEYWDEDARHDATFFSGNQLRGLISHIIPNQEQSGADPRSDDDIPF
jgi:hypothetical protein